MAILTARRSTRSTESGCTTRVAYLVTGRAIATRSEAICASIDSQRIPALPAITTSGECPRLAWYSMPMPLPSPTPECSCTSAGPSLARAYPSAMPTATVSCRARMYSKSRSLPASRKPCSTVPGLPNIRVIPSAANCSKMATLPGRASIGDPLYQP
jgi:hypothetical protein